MDASEVPPRVVIRVLGDICLQRGEDRVPVTADSERRVLARLVVGLGTAVSTSTLIDTLWPDDPPPTARASLQNRVHRLRSLIGREAIVSTGSGYRIDTAVVDVDVIALDTMLRRLAAENDPEERLTLAGRAQELSLGEPFADLAFEPWALRWPSERASSSCACVSSVSTRCCTSVASTKPWPTRIRSQPRSRFGRAPRCCSCGRSRARHAPPRHSSRCPVPAAHRRGDGPGALNRLLRPRTHDLRRRLEPQRSAAPAPKPAARVTAPADRPHRRARGAPSPRLAGQSGHPLGTGRGRQDETGLRSRRGARGVLRRERVLRRARRDHRSNGIGAEVASACGAPLGSAGPAEGLSLVLGHQRALIVLDCCERAPDAVVHLVGELLRQCPALSVVLTSRQRLQSDFEEPFEVTPLSDDAALLFEERAATVRPGFRLSPSNTDEVTRICDAVDRLPLGIEFAAARMASFDLGTIVHGVEAPLDFLRSGRNPSTERHRDLRAVVRWSWDLLEPAEQAVCRQASVVRRFVLPDGRDRGRGRRRRRAGRSAGARRRARHEVARDRDDRSRGDALSDARHGSGLRRRAAGAGRRGGTHSASLDELVHHHARHRQRALSLTAGGRGRRPSTPGDGEHLLSPRLGRRARSDGPCDAVPSRHLRWRCREPHGAHRPVLTAPRRQGSPTRCVSGLRKVAPVLRHRRCLYGRLRMRRFDPPSFLIAQAHMAASQACGLAGTDPTAHLLRLRAMAEADPDPRVAGRGRSASTGPTRSAVPKRTTGPCERATSPGSRVSEGWRPSPSTSRSRSASTT